MWTYNNWKGESIMAAPNRIYKFCSNCGGKIKKDDGICPTCGTTLNEELLYEDIEQVGAGGVGYSDITEHESFNAYKKYTRKVQMIAFPIIAIFLIIVLIVMGTGAIVAIISGIFTYLLLLIISLVMGRKKPSWEGTVVKKTHSRRRRSRESNVKDDIYTVVFKTDAGKRKTQEWTSHSGIYDYLREGDRVRFLGNLGSQYAYEKYDKSTDIEIPCVSCGSMMDPRYKYCVTCGSILLKGKA